jgi:hypothetical protein
MSVVLEDRNLKEARGVGLSPSKLGYLSPSNLRCVARIRLAFIAVAAHIA